MESLNQRTMPESKCPHCGGEHSAGAVFCPATGKAIRPARIGLGWLLAGLVGLGVVAVGVLLLVNSDRSLGPSQAIGAPIVEQLDLPSTQNDEERIAPGFIQNSSDRNPGTEDAADALTWTPVSRATQSENVAILSAETAVPPAATSAQTNPAKETPSTMPQTGASKEPWRACSQAPLSRLHVGMQAYVSYVPPLSNRVRSDAGTSERILGYIGPGEEITILDGPACANGWIWWKIRSSESGLTGWTAEGDQSDYWLVPME
jgi:hypothetical protein